MGLNLGDIPVRSARLYPDAPAILTADSTLTYRELHEQILSCAHLLNQHGIGPGDHVALMLPNVPQFTVNYFAILHLGAVVVPLNVLFVENELVYHLDDSDAKALIVWNAYADHAKAACKTAQVKKIFVTGPPGSDIEETAGVIDQAAQIQLQSGKRIGGTPQPFATNADDTAVILYTSGTTGRAKGAELTHFNMVDNARFVSERLMRTMPDSLPVFTRGHVALATLPLFHSFGQTCIQNAFLFNGAAISLLPRFTPADAANQIQSHGATFFAGVPSMYIAMLNAPEVTAEMLQSLQYAVSGGAALPVEILNEFKARFAIDIVEGYGLSETSPVACFNSLMTGCKPGTVGPAIDLCDIMIADDSGKPVADGERGEIVIRGSNIMKGYYKKPEATAEVLKNGWFHSGDIGVRDDEGYVRIVDRKKEMIIRGGYNIYPREIEEVLYAHDCITEAAVVGVPDDKYGEEVMAVYALKENMTLEHDQLESYCREHLAAYKVPRISCIIDALPKGPTGKVLKRVIKDQYAPG